MVGGSEPPCHADTWLLSLVVSQRQSAPADELSGVVDELLSLVVSQRQSAPADELSRVVDELLSLQVSQRQSAPVDELSRVVDELLSLRVSQRQSASVDELSGVVDERRCNSSANSSLSAGAEVNVTSDVIRITSMRSTSIMPTALASFVDS